MKQKYIVFIENDTGNSPPSADEIKSMIESIAPPGNNVKVKKYALADKEEIKKAAAGAYGRALQECKYGPSLYFDGFMQGMVYEVTRKIPKSKLEELLEKAEKENGEKV